MSANPKTPPASAPILKNASAAPVIYFDNVPVMGSFSGNIEVELGVRTLMPKPNGAVVPEINCVAHLRCSPQAAEALIDALQKGLAIHAKQQSGNGHDRAADHSQPLNS